MADLLYWTSSSDNMIRRAPLAGSGSIDDLYDASDGVNLPFGLAIDPSAGRIYWSNYSDNTIRGAPLDGSGHAAILYSSPQVANPAGVTVDPASRRIYWCNNDYNNPAICRGWLAGGGGVEVLYDSTDGVTGPTSVAIDPAAGRIYWSDSAAAAICGGPIAGGAMFSTLYSFAWGVTGPNGVAIDPAAGRIYWSSYVDSTIRGAPLTAGGTVQTLYGWADGVRKPSLIAIDPGPDGPDRPEIVDPGGFEVVSWVKDRLLWIRNLISSQPAVPSQRIYWPNGQTTRGGEQRDPDDNKIRAAPLAGSGTVDVLYTFNQLGTPLSFPTALALLRAPIGTGAPIVGVAIDLFEDHVGGWRVGGGHSGSLYQRLSCSRGSWAPDLVGSFLYRAPQSYSYQWRLNGTDIAGGTGRSHSPSAPGNYACRVTATNPAGYAVQTSPPVAVS